VQSVEQVEETTLCSRASNFRGRVDEVFQEAGDLIEYSKLILLLYFSHFYFIGEKETSRKGRGEDAVRQRALGRT